MRLIVTKGRENGNNAVDGAAAKMCPVNNENSSGKGLINAPPPPLSCEAIKKSSEVPANGETMSSGGGCTLYPINIRNAIIFVRSH